MKNNFKTLLICCLISIAMFGCKSGRTKMSEEISALEKKAFNDSTGQVDAAATHTLLESYISFSKKYTEDTLSPKYLFKAAQVCMRMSQGNSAIQYLDMLYTNYPKNEKASTALFMQGFVYETILKDKEKAVVCYNKFLKEFPTHPLAKDAKYCVENINKTEEEMIKEFEEKAAAAAASNPVK